MVLQLQWPCSVYKLELVFLCRLKGMERFYGKEFTAVSVTLFSVQTGADIPLPNGKNKKILWQGCHCSFSDPVQCPNWSWYSFAILEEWKDFVAKKSLKFQWPCSVFNLEVIFLCHLGGMQGFQGKEVTAVLVILFNEADIPLLPEENGNILWQRSHWISVTLFSVQSEADIPLTPQGYGNTFQTLVLWNTTVLCIRRAF